MRFLGSVPSSNLLVTNTFAIHSSRLIRYPDDSPVRYMSLQNEVPVHHLTYPLRRGSKSAHRVSRLI
jgi:hypothetical protein